MVGLALGQWKREARGSAVALLRLWDKGMEGLLIRNGAVVDGTGAPGFQTDIRLRDGLIVKVSQGLAHGVARVIDTATSPGASRAPHANPPHPGKRRANLRKRQTRRCRARTSPLPPLQPQTHRRRSGTEQASARHPQGEGASFFRPRAGMDRQLQDRRGWRI